MTLPDTRETSRAEIRIGNAVHLTAEVRVTPKGLLAITALVSGILLSTSVLVATAIREARR